MKTYLRAVVFLLSIVAAAGTATAGSQIVGSWELISQKLIGEERPSDGDLRSTVILMFDSEGHFAWFAIPKGRPKATKPLIEMTREELLAEFRGARAGFVSYEVSGDRLTFKQNGINIRTDEDDDPGYTFRVEADTLTLNAPRGHGKVELRYRRLK